MPVAGTAVAQYSVPRHLAQRILESRAAIEGERKQVSVLFADLKGSMALLAGRDPEEARAILDPVIELMMQAVHHVEGTVNQVMGDGIMALFGAPIAHEDHAVRACYAALRMQAAVARLSEAQRRAGAVPVQIRVGIHSGEVIVRAIGSDLRMDYSAVGQTTHLAARMEQLATPGTTLITADTLALAQGYVQTESLGAMRVAGLEQPVQAYQLTGAGPARTRLQRAPAGSAQPAWASSSVERMSCKPCTRRSRQRPKGTARSSPWWGKRASANRAYSMSSCTRRPPKAGSCCKPAPCRTARPPATAPSSTC